LSIRPRPEIERLEVCPHGGPDYAELGAMGFSPGDILDFSVSSNPFSYPPSVKGSLDDIAIDRYPDSESAEMKGILAEKLGVSPGSIIVGNGSMEIIRLIALTYLGRGDSALILKPTFGEYQVACHIVGAEVIEQWGNEAAGFAFDIDRTCALIAERHPKGVFICNPNNPTGGHLSRRDIERVLETCPDGLVVLDEAYSAFTEGSWQSADLIPRGNIVSVRSMTKDYALAGLRLGYAVAHEDIIENLRRACPPWNVNAAAQKAGVLALKDGVYLKECEGKIRKAKQFLIDGLKVLGFTVLPSTTNFFLVKVDSGKEFRARLLKRGILVRDCASFGLPQYARIAVLTLPQCRRLINVLKEIRHSGELDIKPSP